MTTFYEVRDRSGFVVAIHKRVDGRDGKRVSWLRPDGRPGLDGTPTASLPLYGAHLLDTWPVGETVIVCEGEKAAQALVHAVGTVTGAASTPSTDVLADLAGRPVVCWPDADEPGREHMRRVAELLVESAAVGWLEPPADARKGWDAADAETADLSGLLATAVPFVSRGPDAPSAGKQLAYVTARQLAAETPETVPWRAYGTADGAITELDGKPKASGKTTFLLRLVAAVLEGDDFLGRRTRQTAVVYLSEQGRTSLRAALTRERLLERDDLYLVLWHDARELDWPTLMAETVALCHEKDAALLIIDTLPQFARLGADAENDAGAALTAMQPLQAAAAAGLAVVLSRHDRKGGGEVGESARGSGAFTGVVDVVLALRRGDGESRPTVRHLHGLSRFDEVPEEVIIELTDDGYQLLGTASAYAVEEARSAVLQALADDASLTPDELVAATGLKATTVRTARDALQADGRVARDGAGRKGDPYRYSLAALFPAGPISKGYRSAGKNNEPASAPVASGATSAETGTRDDAPGDLVPSAVGIFSDLVEGTA